MAFRLYQMGAMYYKICIDSYEIDLLECFSGPLNIFDFNNFDVLVLLLVLPWISFCEIGSKALHYNNLDFGGSCTGKYH